MLRICVRVRSARGLREVEWDERGAVNGVRGGVEGQLARFYLAQRTHHAISTDARTFS